jgi:phage tail protein X
VTAHLLSKSAPRSSLCSTALAISAGLACSLAACSSSPGRRFSADNARAHVTTLAANIGSRPVGSAANARAREYVIGQLRSYGFDVRVQETEASRPEYGLTTRVRNVVAVKEGSRRDAIAMVAHYDSLPETPGAADDGLGTAVVLEAARAIAAGPPLRSTVMALLNDGEEAGLMGAAALLKNPDVTDRVRVYLNIDAVGSAGPSHLFETGPGNSWLLQPWASAAPHPRGSSYAVEIYRRLGHDTDFSVLKRAGFPGLNFAPVGDSYAYHTARDTAERLSSETIRQTGENVVAIVTALDGMDLSQRSPDQANYFDVGGLTGLSYGRVTGRILAVVAALVGLFAWGRTLRAGVALAGLARLLATTMWSVVALLAAGLGMVGVAWTLRFARGVLHPWYAHPEQFFLLLLAAGTAVGWTVAWVAGRVPGRLRAFRHPTLVWCAALPFWVLTAIAVEWLAPMASHLWTVPLLVAGAAVAVAPLKHVNLVRAISLAAFVVVLAVWGREILDVLRFMVAMFGRLGMVTPLFVYPILLLVPAIMIAPPFVAAAWGPERRPRERWAALGLAVAVAALAVLNYVAPAYTHERPLRRDVRYVQDEVTGRAFWEVAGNERGAGLPRKESAPTGWRPAPDEPTDLPILFFGGPFAYRALATPVTPPADITATVRKGDTNVELELTVVPREPGATLWFVLPPGVVPIKANLQGISWGNPCRWTYRYVSPPPEGVVFRATFEPGAASQLSQTVVAAGTLRMPGGVGWQGLPAWLPQEDVVWRSRTVYILPIRL